MRRRGRISNEVAGLVALVLVAALGYLAFGGPLPHSEYTLKGVFEDSANLRPGAVVRIAGVDVGKVQDVRPVGRGESAAVVTIRLDDNGRPVHRDARMSIRPRLFLEGNFFVDLRPGTPGTPELRSGATVPINQTASTVQLGTVLEALPSETRADLQSTLRELARSLSGGGAEAFNRTLPDWAPAFRDSAISADATRGVETVDLPRLLAGGAKVAGAIDQSPPALRDLVADLDTTAAAFARQEGRLSEAIGELPRLLRVAYPALGALRDALPPTRALAADARPGVREAAPALRAASPLLRQAAGLTSRAELGGLTEDLAPALPPAARLSRDAVPALRSARAAASCTTQNVLPVLNDKIEDPAFPATGRVYQELPMGLPGVAGESRTGDANGQWIRVFFTTGNFAYPIGQGRFLTTSAPLQGVNPPPPQKRPPLREDVACETQEPADLRTFAAPPPAGFKVNTTSPAAMAIQDAGLGKLDAWVRRLVRQAGEQDMFKVGDEPLRAGQIPLLERAVPGR
jgi:phospholipid/cholesterol/gamma-HCH transport system substrate-binding protein